MRLFEGRPRIPLSRFPGHLGPFPSPFAGASLTSLLRLESADQRVALRQLIHRGDEGCGGSSNANPTRTRARISEVPMTTARGMTGVSCLIGNSECGVAHRYKG